MEHHHRCLYCHTVWFCHEDCPFDLSVCEDCRRNRAAPDAPLRVIDLEGNRSRALDRLAVREAERLREAIRRRRPQ